jgi:hypothetical protein
MAAAARVAPALGAIALLLLAAAAGGACERPCAVDRTFEVRTHVAFICQAQ